MASVLPNAPLSSTPNIAITGCVINGPASSSAMAVNSAAIGVGNSIALGSVILKSDGDNLTLGNENSVVRIPGTLEVGTRTCLVCGVKPELGVLLQGESQSVLFCPKCAGAKLADNTVKSVMEQYAVMQKLEEVNK